MDGLDCLLNATNFGSHAYYQSRRLMDGLHGLLHLNGCVDLLLNGRSRLFAKRHKLPNGYGSHAYSTNPAMIWFTVMLRSMVRICVSISA